MKKVYRDAIDCQNACNLSGVVHTLSGHMPAIWDEVRAANGGTEELNRHPAVQLFVSKIVALTGGCYEPPYEAWEVCESRSGRVSDLI